MAGFEYRKVAPSLWTGATGRWLRKQPATVTVVAMYLVTCPSSTQWGLYYLPRVLIANDTGRLPCEVDEALKRLEAHGFCRYDHEAEVVWVVNMCRDQVGEIRNGDKRAKAAIEAAEGLLGMAFGREWYLHNATLLNLPACPIDAPSMPLPAPETRAEAPSMPGEERREREAGEGEKQKQERVPRALREPSPSAREVSQYLLEAIRSHQPGAKDGTEAWAKDIDLAIRVDERSPERLKAVIDFAHRSRETFWRPNVLSGGKLREKFDALEIQAARASPGRDVRVGHVAVTGNEKYAGGEVKL